MAEIVERINARTPTWSLLGYITPHESQIGSVRNGYQVLGSADALNEFPGAFFVPDNEWRLALPPDDRLVSLVDPSAYVSRAARIAPGCVLYPNSFVGLNAALGRRVFCLS